MYAHRLESMSLQLFTFDLATPPSVLDYQVGATHISKETALAEKGPDADFETDEPAWLGKFVFLRVYLRPSDHLHTAYTSLGPFAPAQLLILIS